jgi:hypothetical protein
MDFFMFVPPERCGAVTISPLFIFGNYGDSSSRIYIPNQIVDNKKGVTLLQ